MGCWIFFLLEFSAELESFLIIQLKFMDRRAAECIYKKNLKQLLHVFFHKLKTKFDYQLYFFFNGIFF